MTLAFILYKYFPFGGLQRDFMRIALECQRRGHDIRVYTLIWEGACRTASKCWWPRCARSSTTGATRSSPRGSAPTWTGARCSG